MTFFGETTEKGKRVYYTQNKKNIYAIFLDWPGSTEDKLESDLSVSLKSINTGSVNRKIKSVNLLGLKNLEPTPFAINNTELTITIPKKTRVPSEIAHVFRIELE